MEFISLSRLRVGLFISAAVVIVYCSWPKAAEEVVADSRVDRKVKTATVRTIQRRIETVKPDGTKTTEIATESETTKVVEKASERSTITSAPALKRYRVGVDYLPSLKEPPKVTDIAVRGGTRIGNSRLWMEGGVDLKHRQLSIGVSGEF